jgi:DNA-binding SARP family transcriptional activator/ABC-type glycerol-3-phosphate transport system substrate-binding protein
VEFRILGPFKAVEDGRTVPITSSRQRALLALLVLHANEPLSADRIVGELWGDSPPGSGAKAVAFHVSRLRRALATQPGRNDGRSILATTPAGYVLRADPDTVDAFAAERLGREGEELLPEQPAEARERLASALGLWHGGVLSDLAYEPFAQQEIERLSELRLRFLEDRLEADLALGRHAELVGELRDLVAANPYRERLRGQLMLALYRCGRQAEALRASQEGRRILVEELGIDPSPELQVLERSILRQDPALVCGQPQPVALRNPFKGLRPFDEADAADFFGREALIERLLERLADVARGDGLLTLVGPSGSGKSSVVRAGLLPAIRRGALPGSQDWRVATMAPGGRPFAELAAALERAGTPPQTEGDLRRPGRLADIVVDLMPGERLVLVIDQFEELFWRVGEDAVRQDFVRALTQALSAAAGRLVVVTTLRADALDRALSIVELAEPVRTGLEVVGRLTRDELERAIARPAAAVGVEIDEGLLARVVADVEGRPGTLPLLQYALTELYDHGAGRRLTCEGYEALGGVIGAVGRRAEAIYHDLGPDAQAVAREVFLRLVAIQQGTVPVARRVARDELRSLDDDRGLLEQVLVAFGRGRLLSFDREPVSREPTVEPAHEALLSSWARVSGWLEDAREDLWMRHRLSEAAAEWAAAARDSGYLLAGSRLALFRDWTTSRTLRLNALEDAYLGASVAEERRRVEAEAARQAEARRLEQRAARWLRASVGLLAGVALLAVGFAGFVLVQGEAGREQQAIAVSRELAAASIGTLATDPDLSLLLAVEAAQATADRGFVTEEAFDALHWAFQGASTAYPRTDAPTAVRNSPDGLRGVSLVPVDQLLLAAIGAAPRALTAEECRTYLHRSDCPPLVMGGALDSLRVLGEDGSVPLEQLANPTLGGTRVRIALELPEGIQLSFADFESDTGIAVEVVPLAIDDSSEGQGDADVIVTPRSGYVLDHARRGRVVDLGSFVETTTLRGSIGDTLVDQWAAELDGVAGAERYGVPFLASLGGLVWYRPDTFDAAGYEAPQTWAELESLTAQMLVDGSAPWCLGLQDGQAVGGSGADWIEDLVLLGAGRDIYAQWSAGKVPFHVGQIASLVRRFGSIVLTDGAVLGGPASALATPASIAGLPLTSEPPRCWLLHGSSTASSAWHARASGLDAFPLPPLDPSNRGLMRGRVYGLAVLSDRPEVRALLDDLLSAVAARELASSLGLHGLYPLGSLDPIALPPGPARTAAERLAVSLRRGAFFADASDAMPWVVGSWVFPNAVAQYLDAAVSWWDGLEDKLTEVDEAWPDGWP